MNHEFRNEIKYILNDYTFNFMNYILSGLLKKDTNCIDKFYTITSIYFDDIYSTSYNQVDRGISKRWKYRIRFYNYDENFIQLEKKYKENNMTKKTSTKINRNILSDILNRKIKINSNNSSLLNEFIIKTKNDYLRPIICIEYDRIPYVYKVGNVRITLDYNIRYTKRYDDLFNKDKKVYYIKNKILEVKYNELLPGFINQRLKLNNLEECSFSKFKNCIDDYNRRV